MYLNPCTKKTSTGALNPHLSIFPTGCCSEGFFAYADRVPASNCLGSGHPLQPTDIVLSRGAAELQRVDGGYLLHSAQQRQEPYVELQENRCCFSICEIKLLESSQLCHVQELVESTCRERGSFYFFKKYFTIFSYNWCLEQCKE